MNYFQTGVRVLNMEINGGCKLFSTFLIHCMYIVLKYFAFPSCFVITLIIQPIICHMPHQLHPIHSHIVLVRHEAAKLVLFAFSLIYI